AASIVGAELSAGHAPEVLSEQGEHHIEILGSLTGTETVLRGEPASGSWVMIHLREARLIGAVVANSTRDTSSLRRGLAAAELVAITSEELADTSVPLRRLLKR